MILKWKIDLKGFENYRFDKEGNLYRVPVKSEDGKYLGLRKIKKEGLRWWLKIDGKWIKRSKSQLINYIKKDETPIIINAGSDMPF